MLLLKPDFSEDEERGKNKSVQENFNSKDANNSFLMLEIKNIYDTPANFLIFVTILVVGPAMKDVKSFNLVVLLMASFY